MKKNQLNFLNGRININEDFKILEIGALNNPLFRNKNVEYLDWFSKEELIEMYPHRAKNISKINYVIKSLNFAEKIDSRFDLVVASHVMEHIPNMVLWLQNVQQILLKGGYLFLALPHKDYTFDYLRPVTKLTDLLDRFYRNVQEPELKDVFEQKYYYRPIKKIDAWDSKLLKEKLKVKTFISSKEAWSNSRKRIKKFGYVDIHCNVFTLDSCIDILGELNISKFTSLKINSFEDVSSGSNEFFVLLKK